ncbi:MAG: DUF5681 domain-containing protein [Sphingomonas sp.]
MSDDGSDDRDYEVGYKKPPLHTRFQTGDKNPRRRTGRSKGVRNLKTDLLEELAERIPINEGDRKVRITKQRALIKSQCVKGIKGDSRAANAILNLVLRLTGTDEGAPEPLSDVDQAILDDFLGREGPSND